MIPAAFLDSDVRRSEAVGNAAVDEIAAKPCPGEAIAAAHAAGNRASAPDHIGRTAPHSRGQRRIGLTLFLGRLKSLMIFSPRETSAVAPVLRSSMRRRALA